MGFGTVGTVPPPPSFTLLDGMPRFIVKVTRPRDWSDPTECYINVLELRPDADTMRPPSSVRSRSVRRVLLHLGPLHTHGDDTPGVRAFVRAERVVEILNRLDLALQAAELGGTRGVKELFEYYWRLEGET
jgi:hypothetical protein